MAVDANGRWTGAGAGVLALPVLLLMAYAVAFACRRLQPVALQDVLVLLLPLVAWRTLPRRWDDPILRRIAQLGCLWVAWWVVGIALHPAHAMLGFGWCAVQAAGLVLLLAVACARIPGDQALLLAGVAGAITLATAAILILWWHLPDFGFGNITYLMCICSPPVWGATALVVLRLLRRQRLPRWPALLVLAGAGLLVAISVRCPAYIGVRRGPLVAGAVAAATVLAACTWTRHRRLLIAGVVAGVVAIAASGLPARAWTAWQSSVPEFRWQRVHLYHACLERLAHVWPVGGGACATMAFDHGDGPAQRHLTDLGLFAVQAHDDLLEVLLDGGVIAGVLWVALVAVAVRRALAIADPVQRAAGLALMAALAVHALTDNSDALAVGRVCSLVWLAVLFRCPARDDSRSDERLPASRRGWFIRQGPQGVALPIALLAGLAGLAEVPVATTATDASSAACAVAAQTAVLPAEFLQAFEASVQRALDVNNFAGADAAVSIGTDRLGRLRPVTYARVGLSYRAWVALRARQDPQARVLAPVAVDCLVTALTDYPLDPLAYRQLDEVLAVEPALQARVPAPILRRLAWAVGPPTLPPPALGRLATADEAVADRCLALSWWLRSGRDPVPAAPAILALNAERGDIPAVACLGATLVIAAPTRSQAWVDALLPTLRTGFVRYTDVHLQAAVLEHMPAGGSAAGAAVLVRRLYPDLAEAIAAGRGPAADEDPTLRMACARVLARARQDADVR